MCTMRASLPPAAALVIALALGACATARTPVGGATAQPGGPVAPTAPRTDPAVSRPPVSAIPATPALHRPPPATPSAEPAYAAPGWTKPREAVEGCVERAVTTPPGLWGTTDPITLKLAVQPDGRVDRVQCITSIEDGTASPRTARRFIHQLEAAVRGCAFEPGRDPAGRPAAMWRFLSVRPAPARAEAR
jgi:hypothetical protein